MPYCTQCGTQVGETVVFCPHCGTRQGVAGPEPFANFGSGLSDRTVAILCYLPVFGLIPSILVLLSERYRRNLRLRFDAFQSLYLFLGYLVLNAVGGWFDHSVREILKLALVAMWVYLLSKASKNQQSRLPIIGDLAARSTYEQL